VCFLCRLAGKGRKKKKRPHILICHDRDRFLIRQRCKTHIVCAIKNQNMLLLISGVTHLLERKEIMELPMGKENKK
jgi:hypothetical protein